MNLAASLIRSNRFDKTRPVVATKSSRGDDNPLVAAHTAKTQAITKEKTVMRPFPLRGFKPDRTLERTLHPRVYARLTPEQHVLANQEKVWRRVTFTITEPPLHLVSPEGGMRVRGQVHEHKRGATAHKNPVRVSNVVSSEHN